MTQIRHGRVTPDLTPREAEVAALIARGRSNSQIARELVIAISTAERHVANILAKLMLRSRAEIAVWAVEHRLIQTPGVSLAREPDSSSNMPPAPARSRHNLPAEMTSFVGRAQEIADLRRELARTRLLTLCGSGGVGKTRLALRVAQEESDKYRDGRWFVDLAPLQAASLVAQAVATAVNVREKPDEDAAMILAAALKPLQLLLVLDNCEHVLLACVDLVHSLLRSCPDVAILATSREPLGVAGESVWRVQGLAVPDLLFHRPADLRRADAVKLFVDRARAVANEFRLTETNAFSVAQVCNRLDGNPLAVELAAARVGFLPVPEIAERLDDRLAFLTAGSRTAPLRLQTLRATIQWSYDLLATIEQEMFRRLAIFSGTFALDAAETVCAGDGIEGQSISDLAASLVAKSLLVPAHQNDVARFRMLEATRQYARELLPGGTDISLREKHALHYLNLAEIASPELKFGGQSEWLERLESDHENIRSALDWALQNGHVDIGMRLGACLWRFWQYRGYLAEGEGWLSRLLAAHRGEDTASMLEVLFGAGLLALRRGRSELAYSRFEKLRQMTLSGDPMMYSAALTQLGELAYRRGDFRQAEQLQTSALEVRKRHGLTWGTINNLNVLARLALERGDPAESRRLGQEAVGLAVRSRDSVGAARCQLGVGLADLAQGDFDSARTHFSEALALVCSVRFPLGAIQVLECFAQLASAERRLQASDRLVAAAARLRHMFGLPDNVSEGQLAFATPNDGRTAASWTAVEQILAYALGGGAMPGRRGKPFQLRAMRRWQREIHRMGP